MYALASGASPPQRVWPWVNHSSPVAPILSPCCFSHSPTQLSPLRKIQLVFHQAALLNLISEGQVSVSLESEMGRKRRCSLLCTSTDFLKSQCIILSPQLTTYFSRMEIYVFYPISLEIMGSL